MNVRHRIMFAFVLLAAWAMVVGPDAATHAGTDAPITATPVKSATQPAAPATRPAESQAFRNRQVGSTDQGGVVIPTGQLIRSAGKTVADSRRPVDLVLSTDRKTVYVKDSGGVLVVDVATWSVKQTLEGGGGSFHGIAVSPDGRHVYSTTSGDELLDFVVGDAGRLAAAEPIHLFRGKKGKTYPCGVAVTGDGKTAVVCLSLNNTLATVDLESRKITAEIPVGVAPFGVVLSPDQTTAYVSNWGGRRPEKGERTADSAGTPALVDVDGIACSGTVSRVDLKQLKAVAETAVGLHPSDVVLNPAGTTLYVANSNSDTVSVLRTADLSVTETILVRPDPALPFASMTNALALSGDGGTLFAANAGNNAVGVIRLGVGGVKSTVAGFIPAGWYPSGIATDGRQLLLANTKGEGSRGANDPGVFKVQNCKATITAVDIPDEPTLKAYTEQVMVDARIPESLAAMRRHPGHVPAAPIPAHLGEPSVFEHVVYILKENRTYDQVLGDMPHGNNDSRLCVFGETVTPNHHAIAGQFALLDNYYCNGSLSADGHAWATQAVATDHYEKAFGGFTRSYDTGTDCLAFAPGGFFWDHLLLAGLSFRNYGEFDFPTAGGNWASIYEGHKAGRPLAFKQVVDVEPLRRFTCPDYPGWNLKINDQLRADVFLKELANFEKRGAMPNVLLVYLPQDHTSGTGEGWPTPRAMVADNDLAVGRIVEAVSKSKFWPDTCIFVNEDDPQAGFDHVDGHRSLCLVASPYTPRGRVISAFYNQASVIHTMEQIFGLSPMNQFDASAPLMSECFAGPYDARPYNLVPSRIRIDEMNPPKNRAMSKPAEDDAAWSAAVDWSRPDLNDDDRFNRVIWRSVRGDEAVYPAEFAGAHGKGLKALGLHFNADDDKDDDD